MPPIPASAPDVLLIEGLDDGALAVTDLVSTWRLSGAGLEPAEFDGMEPLAVEAVARAGATGASLRLLTASHDLAAETVEAFEDVLNITAIDECDEIPEEDQRDDDRDNHPLDALRSAFLEAMEAQGATPAP